MAAQTLLVDAAATVAEVSRSLLADQESVAVVALERAGASWTRERIVTIAADAVVRSVGSES